MVISKSRRVLIAAILYFGGLFILSLDFKAVLPSTCVPPGCSRLEVIGRDGSTCAPPGCSGLEVIARDESTCVPPGCSGLQTHQQLPVQIGNFTIVTAFFNLGLNATKFSVDVYQKWASTFGRMHNHLVVYTDLVPFKELMENNRAPLKHRTSVVLIQNRSSLWAFQLQPQIQKIFDDPNYPKHRPNTVQALYPCSQHAKYELVARTIKEDAFQANHYAWLDVGYFRDIVNSNYSFTLETPTDLDKDKIAYLRIENASLTVQPKDLIRENRLWIGGGMFIGTPTKLLEYFEQYKRAVHVFMNTGLMNTDQQIVYGMFTETGRQQILPSVELQLYIPKPPGNPWFYLGFHCLKKINSTVT